MSAPTVKTEASPSAVACATPPAGSRLKHFLRYWLPVLLWMLVIFGMSTNAGSPRNTSRIIGPILRWFNPNVSEETVQAIQLVVRKTAHVTEYALLALLVWRARRKPVRNDSRPWRWQDAGFAIAVTILFAITDEWHQSFVPTREGCLRDVLIDSGGAVAGLVMLWKWGRWRKDW